METYVLVWTSNLRCYHEMHKKNHERCEAVHAEVVRLVPRCQGIPEQAHDIPFQEIDVGRDPAADEEMQRLSGQRYVPTIVVDGHVLANFDTGQLEAVPRGSSAPKAIGVNAGPS
jgi:glutaredoxin